ncbi:MAG: hypothetical protein UY21_C0008G0002 [Microgenomates group bacterium GW2011_GWA1_48_10]|nr:MAG: hypothetical protein UY21_C0008G0002 [Microgenomates group bacterium GW2011_GWA1_48_10]
MVGPQTLNLCIIVRIDASELRLLELKKTPFYEVDQIWT